MSFITMGLIALASVVISGFVLGMGLGYLWGRNYEDHGPGDPPFIDRGGE